MSGASDASWGPRRGARKARFDHRNASRRVPGNAERCGPECPRVQVVERQPVPEQVHDREPVGACGFRQRLPAMGARVGLGHREDREASAAPARAERDEAFGVDRR